MAEHFIVGVFLTMVEHCISIMVTKNRIVKCIWPVLRAENAEFMRKRLSSFWNRGHTAIIA